MPIILTNLNLCLYIMLYAYKKKLYYKPNLSQADRSNVKKY